MISIVPEPSIKFQSKYVFILMIKSCFIGKYCLNLSCYKVIYPGILRYNLRFIKRTPHSNFIIVILVVEVCTHKF